MKKDKARQIAKEVLEQVGGKDNVSKVLHCQTRLRFNLKDESVVVDEKIEEIKGVLGIVRAGGQIQIVVGPEVKDVYSELCDLANFENKDVDPVAKQKEKITRDLCSYPVLPQQMRLLRFLLVRAQQSGCDRALYRRAPAPDGGLARQVPSL